MAEPQPLPELSGKRRRKDGERAKSRVRSGERKLRIVMPSRQIGKKPRPPSKSPTLFAGKPTPAGDIYQSDHYNAARPIQLVYGGKGEQKHRHIQFGGSVQQVALAKQWIGEYIYSQLIQHAGAQNFLF
ncbi:hypothetical protein LWI28_011426 [Acer negundo]|uniref:Uncharacterized protein n=1 Tax=Acer negundo TaxID=4023 RepID=A0AAD5JP10_ACENE|nr:hypothetical protein LWI28_011426 [Acer negundo]